MTFGEVAVRQYRNEWLRLEADARALELDGSLDEAAFTRRMAGVAVNASNAEILNLEINYMSICGICDGYTTCNVARHLEAMA